MSKELAMQGVKPSAHTFDAFPIYKVNPAYLKEYDHPVVKDSQSASVSGTGSDCTIEYTDPAEQGVLTDLRFRMQAVSGGASTCTFKNPYLIFNSLSLYDDGVLIDEIRNQDEIRCRVSLWERANMDTIYTNKQRNVNATGESITGLVITTSSTHVDLSLLPLFWSSIEQRSTRSFRTLRLQYRFAVDGGTAGTTGLFCVCGSATNEYALLSYSNIKLTSVCYRNSDARLEPKANFVQMIDKFHTVIKNGAFNTADTDYFSIKLKTDFPTTMCCKGLIIYGESPDVRTTYDDAQNCAVVSIPEALCCEVRLNSNVLFSHKLSAADLIKRRRYNYDVQLRNWSVPFDPSAQASGNDINDYLVPLCYIDLTGIKVHGEHCEVLSGIPSSTNIEVDVHCGTTGIDADNTNLHVALHYVEVITKANGVVTINKNPMATIA